MEFHPMTLSRPITKPEIPQQRVEARYGTQADFSHEWKSA